jgi:hypothetical protein
MSNAKCAASAIVLGLVLCSTSALSMDRLNDEQLQQARGGYLSAGGFRFDFGAVVSTWIDGALVLQSKLNLTSDGAASSIGPDGVANPPSQQVSASFNGNGGVTSLLQALSQNSIRNLVVNTADNRTIMQNTAITITLPDLPSIQQGMSLEHLSSALQQALHSGLLESASH